MDADVHLVPDTLDGVIRISLVMKQRFDRAEAVGNRKPHIARLIGKPEELAASAADYCLQSLRESGQFHPVMMILSPFTLQCLAFQNIPDWNDFEGQVALAGPLRVLLATTNAAAYWLASEMWMARRTPGMDPAVRALEPRLREDKREGVLIITATRSSYRARFHETHRAADPAGTSLTEDETGDFTADNLVLQNLFAGVDALAARAGGKLTRRPS